MPFNIRQIDLDRLNSATKYPSILTYHAMGERGALKDEIQVAPPNEPLYLTEKIDGTNTRIIICPDNAVILGSREDLLWERNDLIGNNVMGIIDALRHTCYNVPDLHPEYIKLKQSFILVVYVEAYGKGIGSNQKQYSKNRTGFRVFDAFKLANWEEILSMDPQKIASWRDNGGQPFLNVHDLNDLAKGFGHTVPYLDTIAGHNFPKTFNEANNLMNSLTTTKAKLDDSGLGTPEGIVVRNFNRTFIAKLRKEDYERTIRRQWPYEAIR